MIAFSGNIFILGCGSVAKCSLPLLMKHIAIDPSRITVMDFIDTTTCIAEEIKKGVKYILQRIIEDNYREILPRYIKKGDIFIDLSFGVSSLAMIEWCHAQGCPYLNASMEVWDTTPNSETDFRKLTLYSRQMALREIIQSWDPLGPTAIIDHGANPGLISHLTKQGLVDLAHHFLKEKNLDPRANDIQIALEKENFPNLAYLLGVKTIHISEKDTQISNRAKEVDEFVNTWSVSGFIDEAIAPAEMGWGTHEKHLPVGAMEHESGPRNQICLSEKGLDTWVRSWVPSGPIEGMVIRHGESFTISDYLTVFKDDKVIYRPTVHYAYKPCDAAIESLQELKMRNFVPQIEQRILNDDIIFGEDELGCLLMGHDFGCWWTGSVLGFKEASHLIPHQNATTMQVASAILAAVIYMIKYPNKGLCQPEDLPFKEILEIAKPYLGKIISQKSNWSPLETRDNEEDKWQFPTFLL
ncbi:MAG: saccharopine dehydrogenase C-terminal domain-containing protein [Chlamydiota bacterium]